MGNRARVEAVRDGRATRNWVVLTCLGGMLLGSNISGAVAAEPTGYSRPMVIEKVSVKADGTEPLYPPMDSRAPTASSLSADGRYLAFTSMALDLGADTNLVSDVFWKDRRTGEVKLVSASSRGTAGLGSCSELGDTNLLLIESSSYAPLISGNGRYVAFVSCAIDLVPGDTNLVHDVFIRDMKTEETRLVSTSADGGPANGASGPVPNTSSPRGFSFTPNGRYLAFVSDATDLIVPNAEPPSDSSFTNLFLTEFGRRRTSKITKLTVPYNGEGEVNGDTYGVSISEDARFVAMDSAASNLTEPDPSDVELAGSSRDIFVLDRKDKSVEMVSVPPPDGSSPKAPTKRSCGLYASLPGYDNSLATGQAISADGRYVVFISALPNVIPGDTNGEPDIFVYDRHRERMERVSVDSTASIESGCEAYHTFLSASISGNGRFVVWEATISNFVKHDGWQTHLGTHYNVDSDLFIYDRQTGAQEWVSRALDNVDGFAPRREALGPESVSYSLPLISRQDEISFHRDSGWPWISHDGSMISFYSDSQKLTQQDWDDYRAGVVKYRPSRTFVANFNRALDSGEGVPTMGGTPGNGRRGFISVDDVLGDSELNVLGTDIVGARMAWRPELDDLFIAIDLDHLDLYGLDGTLRGLVYGVSLSVDGAEYQIRAARLGSGVWKIGLFDCSTVAMCMEVGDLKGGVGTIGDSVALSLPMDLISQSPNVQISATGFSSIGTYATGPARYLDVVPLETNPG